MKKPIIIASSIVGGLILLIVVFFIIFSINVGPVSKDTEQYFFLVDEEATYTSLAEKLKANDLIKSEFFYKLYVKLNNPKKELEAGYYKLSENMNVQTILKVFQAGATDHSTVSQETFREGLNMRSIGDIIAEFSLHTKENVIDYQTVDANLDLLIKEYWFLTNDIKNKEIYYALEGYLFPDTYEFSIDSNLKTIFDKFLQNMDAKLTPFKQEIEASSYSIHEILTLASIIELEAGNTDDRAGVAGVFYNRLEDGWSLGSDVTTYYAEKLEMYERDLNQSEIDSVNAYNTRPQSMAGKLPVGPISNPGLESIKAAINPEKHNYYYFVADRNGKTYFNRTNAEHEATVARLKSQGLWYEYD